MTLLYVVTPGASVHKRAGQIVVKDTAGQTLAEEEISRLESVAVASSVAVSVQAMTALLEEGVELAILAGQGRLMGRLCPPASKNIELRKAQYARESDAAFALGVARQIATAKVHNQIQTLLRHTWDEPGAQPAVEEALKRMEAAPAALAQAPDLETLRGLEGNAGREYWKGFGAMLKAPGVAFAGREQRPAPDPVNALLSFGYVLLGNLIHARLEAAGFDPFLGFLHVESYGRPSLALDMVEPFRAPVVDRFVARVFNLGILKPADFAPDGEGGMRLGEKGLKTFFHEWERQLSKMETRDRLAEQMEQLRLVFLGKADKLSPYLWEAR